MQLPFTLCTNTCRFMFNPRLALDSDFLLCHSLLMKTIVSEMGLLEGPPKNRILTHNLELLRQGQYYFAGQLVAWSVANGGPGLGCLSKHMIGLMCGDSVDDLSAAAEHIPDDEIRSVILEVSCKSFVLGYNTVGEVI